MVTADELAQVAIFASLEADARERLARQVADITLQRGDYAAHAGAAPALFGLLEGRIEAVQTTDGIERVVGSRQPGEVFGEVPLTLGAAFPVGFRAAEPSRVFRVEPRDYHAVAAVAPELAADVGRLAAHRIGGSSGLQGLAAAPPAPRAIVIGGRWDTACTELRRFLERNQVSFRWIDEDAPDAEAEWGEPLPGADDLPSVRVLDGETVVRPHLRRVASLLELDAHAVVRPQLRRLAEVLELGTEPLLDAYDVVVVGAGPAGLAAAVYG